MTTGLTLVFIAAKLFGAIDWSWWLVLSPILVELMLIILGMAVVIFSERL